MHKCIRDTKIIRSEGFFSSVPTIFFTSNPPAYLSLPADTPAYFYLPADTPPLQHIFLYQQTAIPPPQNQAFIKAEFTDPCPIASTYLVLINFIYLLCLGNFHSPIWHTDAHCINISCYYMNFSLKKSMTPPPILVKKKYDPPMQVQKKVHTPTPM